MGECWDETALDYLGRDSNVVAVPKYSKITVLGLPLMRLDSTIDQYFLPLETLDWIDAITKSPVTTGNSKNINYK